MLNSNLPIIFFLGTIIGSFLNVCIHRIPLNLSVIRPRSHCPSCNTTIAWHDNIPILSWLILRARCRSCRDPISIRYPLVETLTASLFLLAWLLLPTPRALIGMTFLSILITASFLDLKHTFVPDSLTIGGFLLGLLLSFFFPILHGFTENLPFFINGIQSITTALTGALIGSGTLLWIAVLSEKLLNKEAMGFGDIKLLGCIGAFCGWQGAIFSIFAGALLASIILLPYLLYNKIFHKTLIKSTQIPFTPWLSLAAIIYFFFFNFPTTHPQSLLHTVPFLF